MTNNPDALCRSVTALPNGITPAFTTAQAAAYVGLSESTLEKMRVTGSGARFVRYSRKAVRYLVSDLDAFMAARRVGSTSEKAAA